MNGDGEKLHASVLVAPARERRRYRKQRREAATRLHREQQQRKMAEAKARAEAEKAEQRARQYLPASGESGPAMLRTPGRFHLPRHQDTSATLAGGYPFVAEGGLGSSGVFVGQDLYSGGSFVYDPWVLYANGIITAPNLVLAGIVGSGKSSLMKSLYTRSLPFGRRVYVPGDPKGEHTPVAEAVGGRAIALGMACPPASIPWMRATGRATSPMPSGRARSRRVAVTSSARWPRLCSPGRSPRWSTRPSTRR